MSSPGQPLHGVRVLDLTTFLSGPFCTQILADLGAEVIKVEPPGGDSSRHIPPHFLDGQSLYFLGINRNKRSVSIDLKTDRGRELLLELIAKADVVVENFRPGVARKIGLDIEQIAASHPRLIWASISGFGQTGPDSTKPAYDMIVQALSGVMSITGEVDRPAVRLGIPAGDTVAGLYACIAICAALHRRNSTDRADIIDVAMLDCQLAMLSYQGTYSLVAGTEPGPQGARHDSIPTYRSFKARDGRELVVTANTEKMWRGLCNSLGLAELANDARFATASDRLTNRVQLWRLLEGAFLEKDAAEHVESLQANDVPAALIKRVPEALDDARVAGRDMIVGMQAPGGRRIEVVGNPIKFAGGPDPDPTYPPALGQDNASVLSAWLGMPRSAADELLADGVLGKGSA
ncbi:CoA transferase [Sphingomonas sp. J344]|uniref:CaiB/BaiF CoA transferase family protein n=1 Tax=Sphingomonas sp. J344 TaxID=2898434 RepID=UPI0021508E73|nr:CoA transferase [Sphingomonas sp. J344]MCR5871209.1 CoA transferase [Sphingomonas sp. J344]